MFGTLQHFPRSREGKLHFQGKTMSSHQQPACRSHASPSQSWSLYVYSLSILGARASLEVRHNFFAIQFQTNLDTASGLLQSQLQPDHSPIKFLIFKQNLMFKCGRKPDLQQYNLRIRQCYIGLFQLRIRQQMQLRIQTDAV